MARSRDPGLHGRKPVFRSPRALAESYFDPYIDYTGCVTGYAVTHLRVMGSYDWRFSRRNVWAVENMLLERRSPARSSGRASACKRERQKYRDYLAKHKKKPLYYRGREKWSEIPKHFSVATFAFVVGTGSSSWRAVMAGTSPAMTQRDAPNYIIANSEFLRSVTSMQPG